MKNLKLAFLSVLFVVCCFTSCTNNEPVVEEQNIEESASITTSLSQLRTQFDNQGDVIPTENPTGNIVFDFCFDFVYPINLSYNNGTTVTVNNLEDLIDVTINSTNDLYIDGIEFPFDVEVYNDETDAIETATINNEEEFIVLLESCDFNDGFDCECTEEYAPVCVEITAPDGETFLMTYPNACYAECDGFTENDFAENCEEDYNCPGGTDCFSFNFPLTIITDNGDTITVGSQEELDTVLYNVYYFDFVYSFDVTLEDGTVLTIGNEEAFIELLETCFGGNDGGNDCGCDEVFDPVCVQYEENGEVIIEVFANACYAECEGFTENDFVECGNQSGCSEEDVSILMVACQFWTVTIGDQEYTYIFGSDGTVTVNLDNEMITTGTWSTSISNDGLVVVNINTESGNFTSDWTVYDCNENNPTGPNVVSSAAWITNIESGCE
jgi:hypothetical protein|nr:hypothetical protein [uncultured Psychroserpens sp.]